MPVTPPFHQAGRLAALMAAVLTGLSLSIVNGVLVIDRGNHTGTRPGRALKGPGTAEF